MTLLCSPSWGACCPPYAPPLQLVPLTSRAGVRARPRRGVGPGRVQNGHLHYAHKHERCAGGGLVCCYGCGYCYHDHYHYRYSYLYGYRYSYCTTAATTTSVAIPTTTGTAVHTPDTPFPYPYPLYPYPYPYPTPTLDGPVILRVDIPPILNILPSFHTAPLNSAIRVCIPHRGTLPYPYPYPYPQAIAAIGGSSVIYVAVLASDVWVPNPSRGKP